jgi:hypothetical protein
MFARADFVKCHGTLHIHLYERFRAAILNFSAGKVTLRERTSFSCPLIDHFSTMLALVEVRFSSFVQCVKLGSILLIICPRLSGIPTASSLAKTRATVSLLRSETN